MQRADPSPIIRLFDDRGRTRSLAHPEFSDAVERFLEREQWGIERYVDELNEHSPFKGMGEEE
ncbi:MAG: hypothetical protein V1796_05665 [Pseudomonadota bacterium]